MKEDTTDKEQKLMSKRNLKNFFGSMFPFSLFGVRGTDQKPLFEGTVAEIVAWIEANQPFNEESAKIAANLRKGDQACKAKVIPAPFGALIVFDEGGCGRPDCTTCGKSSKSSAGRPDDFGDFIREFEEFFGGRRQRPDWRSTLAKFQSGGGNEPDVKKMLNSALGVQTLNIARLKAQLSGLPLIEVIQSEMGELAGAIADATAGEAAVSKDASELFGALGEAKAEMDEFLARLDAMVQSAGSSNRGAFTAREILTAVYRAKRGLDAEEHYFPQKGQSYLETVAANAEARLARFVAAEAALRELGETGVADVLAQLLSGKGDPTAIIREKFAGAEVTLDDGPLESEMTAEAAEANV